jgi:hypothetical protein
MAFSEKTQNRILEITDSGNENSHQASRRSPGAYLLKLIQYLDSALASLVTCSSTYLQDINPDNKVWAHRHANDTKTLIHLRSSYS